MANAIMTSFVGPSNTKPSRVKVTWYDVSQKKQRLYVNWDHSKGVQANHVQAACVIKATGWCIMTNEFGPDSYVHCLYPEL
jgi:hypothetical protein